MSVHAKAVLTGTGGILSFTIGVLTDIGALAALPKPWPIVLIAIGFLLLAMSSIFKCPKCGHRVASRPGRLLGGVPTTMGAGFMHVYCYFCGYNLRETAAAPPNEVKGK
jgi:hypothetical protein